MTHPIVIAYDPGATTGWAMWNYPEGAFGSGQGRLLDVADWTYDFLEGAKGVGLPVQVVMESFVITANTLKKSRETSPLDMIGALKWMAHRFTETEVVLQSPSAAKSFSTDHKLKKAGWFTPGKVHANDAARHLMLYTINAKLIPISFVA